MPFSLFGSMYLKVSNMVPKIADIIRDIDHKKWFVYYQAGVKFPANALVGENK